MVDTKALDAATDLVALVRQTVELKQDRIHWVGLCPFHKETTPSFKVTPSKGAWKCFGCGKGGHGAVSWLVDGLGIPFKQAVEQLQGGQFIAPAIEQAPATTKKKATAIFPIPADVLRNRPTTDKELGERLLEWCYKDADGAPMFYVYRWNVLNEDGTPKLSRDGKPKKEIKPLIYTASGWRYAAPAAPRPLYGLDRIAASPKAPVAIFEGEKCADFAAARSKAACIAWQGGADGVRYTEWAPLAGRTVILNPDHDEAGWRTMEWLGTHLETMDCRVMWCATPSSWDKGKDVADSGWQEDELRAHLKSAVPFSERGENPHIVVVEQVAEEFPTDEEQVGELLPIHSEEPFVHLGYERTAGGDRAYWFYVKAQEMTLRLTPSAMTESGFLQLASLGWWQGNFRGKGGKLDRTVLMNMLIQRGNAVGMFDVRRIRGRGAWRDNGRLVVHAGSHLVVDGKRSELLLPHSQYVYEQRLRIGFDAAQPLKKEEASKYLDLCKMMNWDAPVMAHLLAGWVVVAPLCGILDWRPHIWIVGSARVGKSTIMEWLVSRMLGDMKIAAQGLGTTEAALRQTLSSDGLPVVFDEIDVDSVKAKEGLQNILTLIRSMSTGSGAGIIKGSGSGNAVVYELRSCFVLASIAYGAERGADRSRMSLLSLHPSKAENAIDDWNQRIRPAITGLITPEFVQRFQARTVALAKTIMANAVTFRQAVAEELQDQRAGDQLGPLLAGAWSLVSDSLVTADKARTWVASHQWTAEKDIRETRDEQLLLDVVLEQRERFTVNGASQEMTVARLICGVAWPKSENLVDHYKAALEMRGMEIRDGFLYIAGGSQWMRDVLRDKPFNSNASMLLARIDNAEALPGKVVIGGKKYGGVVKLPLGSLGLEILKEDDYKFPF